MSIRTRFPSSPLLSALLVLALATPAAFAAPQAAEKALPDEVQKQINEETEKLPEDVREKVRKQIADAVAKEIEAIAAKRKDEAEKEKPKAKPSDSASSEKKEEKTTEGSESTKPSKPETPDTSGAKELKKLQEEVALQEARFKHSVAMYEKQLEDKRLTIEKQKIDRRIKTDESAEEQATLQRDLDKMRLEVELQKRKSEAEQLRVEGELAKLRADKLVIEQSLSTEDSREKAEERVLGEESYPDQPFKNGVLTISLRRIELNGPIYAGAADYVCQRLDYYNNQSEKPIFIVIDDCPGGSAIEGFEIVQAIRKSKSPVHVVIKRMAASMAAIIATLADHSYCYPDAIILHHQASARLSGTGRDIDDQVRQFKQISERLIGAVAKKLNISEKEFVDQMYSNRASGDWDLFGDEAVKRGWIEHVATTIREQGVRSKPKGMRSSATLIILGQAPENAAQGYQERYEVQLKEETDAEGKHFVRLPRLSPLDAYLIYNPDGYYR